MNIDDIDKFQGNLSRLLEDRPNTTNTDGGPDDLDEPLNEMTKKRTEIEKLIEVFQEALKEACEKLFRQRTMKKITNKSVPWWTDELTVMRKRTNALGRRYQRKRKH